ncbi:hypothetical protein [Celerinatantimonas sp. YJH-8]|uniref:hypothetical protein n=1 Tax=Celerinatantimonas sp. YJH-8 TaxID=3228714 RepID=UPI0038CB5FA3
MVYHAYQLAMDSELHLPELIQSHQNHADIHIKFGNLGPVDPIKMPAIGPCCWTNQHQFRLHIPGVARYEVRQGTQIIIDPAPDSDEDSLRVFLLGSALGALLFQRKLLVLHGNAIQIGQQCMVCVGISGAGKSTLAAGFMQRGYPVLADDVVPVTANGEALPGFARIKLWQDVATRLNIDTQNLRRIRPELNKFNYPVPVVSQQTALPIRWIYTLSSHNDEDIQITPITGLNKFMPLLRNTYRPRFINGMGLKSDHLKWCSGLAGKARMAHLSRPKEGFSLDAMIDTILSDIEDQQ